MNWSGRPAEALKIEEEATRRDPRNRDFHLMEMGIAYYRLGRPAEALPILRRFDDSYPDFVDAQLFLTASYAQSGMMEEAHAEAAKLMKSSPGFSLEEGLFKGLDPQDRLISDLRKAGLK
jgi:predicted Zn-dependent protease